MCAYNYTYRYNIKAVFTSGGATRHYIYTTRYTCTTLTSLSFAFRIPSLSPD